MPYASNADLPDGVRNALAGVPHALEIWRKAFNSAMSQYNDEGKAAATAWAAVKTKYEKRDGEWVRKMDRDDGVIRGAEIFATGRWNNHEYTEADLDEIVTNLPQQGFRPPVKLGHKGPDLREDGKPAAGWVENVRKVGQKLVADLTHLPKVLAQAIRDQRFDRLSPELYVNYDRNGKAMRLVLKAVSLLGEDVPAIPDLAPLHMLGYSEAIEDGVLAPVMALTYEGQDDISAVAFDVHEHRVTDKPWNGDKSRFTTEQLLRAVPRAVAAWARKRAYDDATDRAGEVNKDDLKLPYKEPDGTINANGVRAALAAIGGARTGKTPALPGEVLTAARAELERIRDGIKARAMAMSQGTDDTEEGTEMTEEQVKAMIKEAEERVRTETLASAAKERETQAQAFSKQIDDDRKAREAKDTAKDAEIAALKRINFERERDAFIGDAKAEGRLTPAQEPVVKALYEVLAGSGTRKVQMFAADGKTLEDRDVTGTELLESLLGSLPKRVEFREMARVRDGAGEDGWIDPSAEVHTRVEKYRSEHPTVEYTDAMKIVLGQDRRLKEAYIAS